MFESDMMLSVSTDSEELRQEIWQELRDIAYRLRKKHPTVKIMMTANDEEDITPDFGSDLTPQEMAEAVTRVRTEVIDKIAPVIKKALLEQDRTTYHGSGGNIHQLAGDTAVEVLKAMQ